VIRATVLMRTACICLVVVSVGILAAVELLLDPPPAPVERVTGEAEDVAGSICGTASEGQSYAMTVSNLMGTARRWRSCSA
jgi:hypothetical protein